MVRKKGEMFMMGRDPREACRWKSSQKGSLKFEDLFVGLEKSWRRVVRGENLGGSDQ